VSQEDVEVVRRIYGFNWAQLASQQEGLAEAAEVFSPDFEYHLDPVELGRVLRGLEELQVFLQAIEEDFREFKQVPQAFREIRGHVVVLGDMFGRGRQSGVPFHSPFGHVWTLRDGKAVRLDGYLDHDAAVEIAGLEEWPPDGSKASPRGD
jgi:ketosteroid isomerase-like protein